MTGWSNYFVYKGGPNSAALAVNPCMKFLPPIGPNSPWAKKPASGMGPSASRSTPASWSGVPNSRVPRPLQVNSSAAWGWDAAPAADRAFKSSSSIICYELPWNHIKFDTQMFVKLSEDHIQKKIEILNFYKSQFYIQRPYLTEDFIRGLAFTRGAQVGHQFAEAFEVIRWIE